MFGLLSNNPMLLNILSQIPMQQQPTQIVDQPMLSATQGIGSSLPDYRQMSMENYALNMLNQASPGNPLLNLAARMGIIRPVNNALPQEATDAMLQKIRSMSPEEYERFAVYR